MSKTTWPLLLVGVWLFASCASTSEPIAEKRSFESARWTFDSKRHDFHELYNLYLAKNPELEGRLILRLSIAADGHVEKTEIVRTTIDDTAFTTAVINEVNQIQFGRVSRPGLTVMTYALEFHPRATGHMGAPLPHSVPR